MKQKIVLLATALLLVLTGTAQASLPTSRPLTSAPVAKSLQIAAQFHGATADCHLGGGVFLVTRSEMENSGLGTQGAIGYAWAQSGLCGIWIANDAANGLPAYAAAILTCSLIVHEYGHLLGKGHSGSLSSVMYPVTDIRRPVFACYKTFLPSGYSARFRALIGGPPLFKTTA